MPNTRIHFLYYLGINISSLLEIIQLPIRLVLRLTGLTTLTGLDVNWDINFLIWWAERAMGILKDAGKASPLEIARAKSRKRK